MSLFLTFLTLPSTTFSSSPQGGGWVSYPIINETPRNFQFLTSLLRRIPVHSSASSVLQKHTPPHCNDSKGRNIHLEKYSPK
jgi:hypothetical protein